MTKKRSSLEANDTPEDNSQRPQSKKTKTWAGRKLTTSSTHQPPALLSNGTVPAGSSSQHALDHISSPMHDSLPYYQGNTSNSAIASVQRNLNKIFDNYRDNAAEADKFGLDGAQRYLSDLSVSLEEVAFLALCELVQCPSLGEFEREPFVSGWRSLSPTYGSSPGQAFDTISRQAQHMNAVRKKLPTDPVYLKQVYRNAFKIAKPEGQKSVPMEVAFEFWKMFFQSGHGGIQWNSSTTNWLDLWLEFYAHTNKRPVNKDLWNMLGDLVLKTKEANGESLEWWTEDGAWPMVIDEFIGSVKDKRKAADETMDTN